MSKSLTKLFTNNIKLILFKDTRYEYINNKSKIWLNFILTLCGSSIHCIYTVSSSYNIDVKIINKYQIVRNGFTDFMVIDDQDRHFNVNNSSWYWKWNSSKG